MARVVGRQDLTFSCHAPRSAPTACRFTVDDSKSRGIFDGNCRIVPSLSAPGFCNAEAKSGFLAGMPDVSSYYNGGGLTYTYASTGELKSFKAAFGTKLQHDFGSFKADFEVISDGKVRDVFIPFSSFSNKWSASTGEPTTACSSAHPEVCPTAKSLSEIGAVGIWAEGVAGQFHVELLKISATNGTTVAADKNIVELAQSVPTLSTLVTAVVAANLTGVLSSPGPFTVFAPNNDAFSHVPADLLKHLLEPAHIAELQEVLELHVVAGAVYAADLKNDEKIKTVNSLGLEVKLAFDKVFILVDGGSIFDGAEVIAADNVASNGVVHIINRVLLPTHGPAPGPTPTPPPAPAAKNIVELAQSVPTLSTLVTAVVAANLTGVLSSPGPFTVFAPNNDAFAKVPADILKHLLEPRNIAELQEVLELHVVAGAVYAADLKDHEKIKTVNGLELEARLEDSKVFIEVAREHSGTHGDYAEVIAADNVASNGVVHIIDHVLYPMRGQQRRLRGSA